MPRPLAPAAVDGVHFAQHRAIDLAALGAEGCHRGGLSLQGAWSALGLSPPPRGARGWEPYRGGPRSTTIAVATRIWHTAPRGDGWPRRRRRLPRGAARSRSGEQTAGERRAAIVAAFDAIGAHERALARRFLEGLASIAGYACTASNVESPDERTPTFAVAWATGILGDREGARRARHLRVGRALLRDRALRPSWPARHGRRSTASATTIPRRGGTRPRRSPSCLEPGSARTRCPFAPLTYDDPVRGRIGPPGRLALTGPLDDACERTDMRILILGGDGYLGWPTAMRPPTVATTCTWSTTTSNRRPVRGRLGLAHADPGEPARPRRRVEGRDGARDRSHRGRPHRLDRDRGAVP